MRASASTSNAEALSKTGEGASAMPMQRLAGQDDTHYLNDDDGDDVFSNPDTAELDTRSDATGATSPTPHSPGAGPSSPSIRGQSHIAIVAGSGANTASHHASLADTFGSLTHLDTSQKPLILTHMPPPPSAADMHRQWSQTDQGKTPRPPSAQLRASTPRTGTLGDESIGLNRRTASGRPSFLRTKSASGASAPTGSPSVGVKASPSLGKGYSPGSSRLGGHGSSMSTPHATLDPSQLPSAHGLPADPEEALALSKLFAHAPMHSPGEEQPGFAFAPMSPSSVAASPSTAQHENAFASSRRSSRPVTRPASPERLIAAPVRRGQTGSVSQSAAQSPSIPLSHISDTSAAESSIFERDIEHRNAAHVLSKQEAIDVAIPSVLDDAVEAIAANDGDIEIVAPHAAMPPLALSAQALTAHSHSQSALPQSAGSGAMSASPPRSSVGVASVVGAVEPPPGSMAAQIAERFAQQRGSVSAGVNEGTSQAAASRSRRPLSEASVSSSSSAQSRGPAQPIASVQNILALGASPSSPRSASHSPPAASKVSRSPSGAGASRTTPSRPGIVLQPSNSTLTPSKAAGLPTASALPTLPLPNPFRGTSPSVPHSPSLDLLEPGSAPMQSSVSMDGAVMPNSESAIGDASLSGLADVVASAKMPTHSPATRLRGLALTDESQGLPEASPYSSRSPARSQGGSIPPTPVSPVLERQRRGRTPAQHSMHADESASSLSAGGKKRLSFFSYADVINDAPAEVMRMDEALHQADASSTSGLLPSFSSTPTLATAAAASSGRDRREGA